MTTDTDRIESRLTDDYLLQIEMMRRYFYQNACTVTTTKRSWKQAIMNQPFFGRAAIDQCIEKIRGDSRD